MFMSSSSSSRLLAGGCLRVETMKGKWKIMDFSNDFFSPRRKGGDGFALMMTHKLFGTFYYRLTRVSL